MFSPQTEWICSECQSATTTRRKYCTNCHSMLTWACAGSVDSTVIAIPEPYDSEQRKAYNHAKSPTNYAIKVQIACDFRHRIVHVSECYQGSVHDITVLRDSGLLEHVEDSVQIIGD
ncbi:unnamed protein product [Rotaria sordida]|uniref:DDE Tnp4 domain-containing protein n=1 Tax=Rotaria sordida TaxID=392033 RepID=A0A815FFJ3_9BILA|nr:unnamed protein product [Rotaria sordida]CAF4238680.1 unnamed protein product [Rotaria sordida]